MFLVTGSLREFWDTGDELLIAGPWCLDLNDPASLDGLKHRMLPNIWDDRPRLAESARTCRKVSDRILKELGDYLNAVHETKFSLRFWSILLGPWLIHYTHQLYDRTVQIQEALKAYPDARTFVLNPQDFHTPTDTNEFMRLFYVPHQDLQLYSLIFRGLGMKMEERRHELVLPNDGKARGLKQSLRGLATRSCEWAIRHAGARVVTDGLYPAGRSLWSLIARMRGRALPLLGTLPKTLRLGPVSDERRTGLAGIPAADEFEGVLVSTLPVALPTIFLEGFSKARKLLDSGPVPRAVIASTELTYNDYFKLNAAFWTERGARLLGVQHGGCYGSTAFSLAEDHERSVTDVYFGWGWARTSGDEKLRDLPQPRLSSVIADFNGIPRSSARDILLISAANLRHVFCLFSMPLGSQWQEYFTWRERFIAALPAPQAAVLSVRRFPVDLGWDDRKRLENKFSDIRLDDPHAPLLERLKSVRLTVLDYPGTCMIEVLGLGLPCLLFWRPAHWEMRPEARPYFDALREAGILHDDPESAAAQAAAVYGDTKAWWSSAPVQKARREFAERFALTSPGWLDDWTRELDSQAAKDYNRSAS